jgi:hypothetical protein
MKLETKLAFLVAAIAFLLVGYVNAELLPAPLQLKVANPETRKPTVIKSVQGPTAVNPHRL